MTRYATIPFKYDIENQEQHHKTQSFQDEYRMFLTKYGIEYDERYIWD